jgi:hypothetical protein
LSVASMSRKRRELLLELIIQNWFSRTFDDRHAY